MSDTSDPIDAASDYTEKWLEAQISEHMYQLNQVGHHRDIEAETCNGCPYATKAGWGHKCDGWKDCRDDIEKRERFNKVNV